MRHNNVSLNYTELDVISLPFLYNQALRKSSRAVRYFPSLRAVVNQMVRNLQRGAVLSTSSADTGLHGGGTGTCISLIYYRANKKTNSFFQYCFALALGVLVQCCSSEVGFPHKHGREA